MKLQEIFVPNDVPTVTYVDRSEHKLEATLRDHFNTPNMVISISGPSKSGKTVLIKKVVSEERLITVIGAGISSADDLWNRVLAWMGSPSEVVVSNSTVTTLGVDAKAGGGIKIPLLAQSQAEVGGSAGRAWDRSVAETRRTDALTQVIHEIGGSDFTVFIDDFHYINSAIRDELGRQIKAAAESGVRIITASVPHRADDVVRSNPELRGRVAAVDLTYWTAHELTQIAAKGFRELNVDLAPAVVRRMVAESFGSPQLMQAVCLNLCYTLDIREPLGEHRRVEVSEERLTDTLLRTSAFTDFSKMVVALHTGPRTRGTERKIHDLSDGTSGDVYRAILLALKDNPAELSFAYDNLNARIRRVCVGDTPAGSSVTSALEQMDLIADQVQPNNSPISWDGDAFEVADPYFLFFLRCSSKLAQLSQPRAARREP